MTIIDNLRWRYAVNRFDITKTIPEESLACILEAGNLAATSYGLQPFQFVVVRNQDTRNQLVQHAYGQTHFAKNSILIVLAARTDIDEAYITEFTDRIEKVRSLPPGSVDGYKAVMLNDLPKRTPEARLAWAREQAFIALGTMIAAASELRIDNHAMTGFNSEKFNEILDLNTAHLRATVALALGYRSPDDDTQNRAKVRKELKDMIVER